MASFTSGLRLRLQKEESGFTLIELLIVFVILGILLTIAVPSYLGLKDRAKRGAAEANVRSAVPAVEAFYADNGSYSGMSLASLQAIDAGVKIAIVSAGTSTYCISNTQGTFTAYKGGPAAAITSSPCT